MKQKCELCGEIKSMIHIKGRMDFPVCDMCYSDNYERIRDAHRNMRGGDNSQFNLIYYSSKGFLNKKNIKYDCVIPASGGFDSSYVLCYAKYIGWNPLVISYDSGFNTKIARDNLERLCDRFNFDLLVFKSDWDKKYIKAMTRALSGIGIYFGLCKFCIYMIRALTFRETVSRKIPIFLMASNPYEEKIELRASVKIKSMLKEFLKLNIFQMIKTIFYLILAEYYFFRLKLEFYVPFTNIFATYPTRPKNSIWVNPENFIEWDIETILKTLEENGWEHPKDKLMRFDCTIERDYIDQTYKKVMGKSVYEQLQENINGE